MDDLRHDISILLDNCADALLSPLHTKHDGDKILEWNRVNDPHLILSSSDRHRNVTAPYSVEQLLTRLSSFNASAWNIPGGLDATLNELICASNGWCLYDKLPSHKSLTNHIICSTCGCQLIFRFEKSYADLAFNQKLADNYAKQVTEAGHSKGCLWRSFEFTLLGSYYLRMHIPENDEMMVTAYLRNLKSFIDSRDVCLVVAESLKLDLESLHFTKAFVDATEMWLTRRFYRHDKENVRISTQSTWMLELAAWGWSLYHRSRDNNFAIVLTCDLCFQKVYLALEQDAKLLEEGSARPAQADPRHDHKLWCRHSHNMVSACGESQNPATYLIRNFVEIVGQDA